MEPFPGSLPSPGGRIYSWRDIIPVFLGYSSTTSIDLVGDWPEPGDNADIALFTSFRDNL
jgi:hypothetical protein